MVGYIFVALGSGVRGRARLLCRVHRPQDCAFGFSISWILDGLNLKKFLALDIKVYIWRLDNC